MIDAAVLQPQVKYLVDDLRGQVAGDTKLRAELREEHAGAVAARRTAATFETWLEDILDQAAVAWVLGCVFVRFCEDNELVRGLWLGGPLAHAPAERALQHRQAYLIENPRHNDRHWLRVAFEYLGTLRATGQLFDQHNPVWRFHISGEAAEVLSDFFRRGEGALPLRDPELKTRFLGDLYQELSTHAKKTYALLQTPEFVEEFILDRAFEPAVDEFGLAETKLIDPTCGSGHFLLGAFHRLVRKWRDREPNTDIRVLTVRALNQVTGVDINPFAVAIARFRLLVEAMKVIGHGSLETAPNFLVRVATGDSLLPWGDHKSVEAAPLFYLHRPFSYAVEDADLLAEYLRPNQYAVVVGNPPYITVKDKALSELYRESYPTVCYRQYALTVPFAKRFFDLALRSNEFGFGGGFVGQIAGNAFMKREFGKRLVEDYFAHRVELTEVIDTSGAYIPGHGTPTVILVGRANDRRRGSRVRAILGVRGEASTPKVPGDGLVWRAIIDQIERPGSESDWVTSLDLDRSHLSTHPWSLSGGGATAVMTVIAARPEGRLGDLVSAIGRITHTGSDDSYFAPPGSWRRFGVADRSVVPLVAGDVVRDWGLSPDVEALFPYDSGLRASVDDPVLRRILWLTYAVLRMRREPGGTHEEIGLTWFEWSRWHPERFVVPLGIGMAFVATHNHFVLDRGGRVFNRSAPVIKLPEGATEDDHLRLLGVLNSSTACFWLKQVSHNKGSQGVNEGFKSQEWERFYEFTGTKLEQFPLPSAYPLDRARRIDHLARRLSTVTPAAIAASTVPTRERLKTAEAEYTQIRAQMIALQEELDWEVYRHYGLLDEDLTTPEPPEVELGQRAFEIVLARRQSDTQWFARHGSTPITEIPAGWPADYRALVQRRIDVIGSDRNIALIERPECKRRWAADSWSAMRTAALRDWLLDRLEAAELWGGRPIPLSVAQLADRVRHDEDFRTVLDLWVGGDNWVGRDEHDLARSVARLVADEHVPFLPAHRYKPSGLRKRAQWERTWALQRREDAGESVTIEVPPKYTSADFSRPSYWRARGKLDVPKERFISYPRASRDEDGSELLGWAGWDHLAQAQALATVYLERKAQSGWPAERLLPLLAGLVDLEPWLHQWHTAQQPGYPGSPAVFFTDFVDGELAQLDADRSTLARLRGVPSLA